MHCSPGCGTAAEEAPAVTHMVQGGKTKQQKLICTPIGLNLSKKMSLNPEHRTSPLPDCAAYLAQRCAVWPRSLRKAGHIWAIQNEDIEEKSFKCHFSS